MTGGNKWSGEVYPGTSTAASEGEAAIPAVGNSQLRLSGREQGFVYWILQHTNPQKQLKPTRVWRFA